MPRENSSSQAFNRLIEESDEDDVNIITQSEDSLLAAARSVHESEGSSSVVVSGVNRSESSSGCTSSGPSATNSVTSKNASKKPEEKEKLSPGELLKRLAAGELKVSAISYCKGNLCQNCKVFRNRKRKILEANAGKSLIRLSIPKL